MTKKHNHYHKPVTGLGTIDVYDVLRLFEVQSHPVGHAIKKLLMAGKRGAKDYRQDLQEAIDSVQREIEIYHKEMEDLDEVEINGYPEAEDIVCDDGWIKWDGGECPVSIDAVVEYKMRYQNKEEFKIGPAKALWWFHEGSCGDIIAYRISKTS